MNNQTITAELREVILEALKTKKCNNSDDLQRLHEELFDNFDKQTGDSIKYIVGQEEAEQWLTKHGLDYWDAYYYVKNREEDRWCEMVTETDTESIVDGFVYWYAVDVIFEVADELNIKY